jgi:co-chaperonin GroES (HSP10)
MSTTNSSGITPSGDRVVIKPDALEEVTEGGIVIAKTVLDSHQHAQSTGILIAVGPDAFTHSVSLTERFIDGAWKPVERTTTGYKESFAEVGDRVAFAKFGGLNVEGADGVDYKVMNDQDITARVSDAVSFNDVHGRKRVGER